MGVRCSIYGSNNFPKDYDDSGKGEFSIYSSIYSQNVYMIIPFIFLVGSKPLKFIKVKSRDSFDGSEFTQNIFISDYKKGLDNLKRLRLLTNKLNIEDKSEKFYKSFDFLLKWLSKNQKKYIIYDDEAFSLNLEPKWEKSNVQYAKKIIKTHVTATKNILNMKPYPGNEGGTFDPVEMIKKDWLNVLSIYETEIPYDVSRKILFDSTYSAVKNLLLKEQK